ncbi:hypothetical protein AX15_002530 [Amanita polypyramis BW_CC]|nr:hypothetical protein AX15_002530 [Amanita polypyramis BW_CC]
MSDIYSALQVSPRKKRRLPEVDGGLVLTPKKLRVAPPTPPATKTGRRNKNAIHHQLPAHLSRLVTIQISLQHALSHALATCAVSPSQETGVVRNVLNHLSLATYTGLTVQINLDDLRRLCWLWEWDGRSTTENTSKLVNSDEDDNPFLDSPVASTDTDWVRGAMGFVISPAMHYSKSDRKRVPAFGIGIEVEMDIDKDMKGGMAAVARWTAAADKRRHDFRQKLERWVELHSGETAVPVIPLANLPSLPTANKMSSLTRTLVSGSPTAPPLHYSLPCPPSSSSKMAVRSSKKHTANEFTLLPVTPSRKGIAVSSIKFPQTPSRRNIAKIPLTPHTPSSCPEQPRPSTPVHQLGKDAFTAPQTPTTSRRQALYERIRQRSLSISPTKARTLPGENQGNMSRDQLLKFNQEETRRRCLLGRLNGVAESVWMLFSTPAGTSSSFSTPLRRRRALPASEATAAIIKSSPVPISVADADDSIALLIKLCPFFLRRLQIEGEDWLEMPANSLSAKSSDSSPTKKLTAPSSPGAARGNDGVEELVRRSPRSVKKEMGGLREVREIIRREIEMQD